MDELEKALNITRLNVDDHDQDDDDQNDQDGDQDNAINDDDLKLVQHCIGLIKVMTSYL